MKNRATCFLSRHLHIEEIPTGQLFHIVKSVRPATTFTTPELGDARRTSSASPNGRAKNDSKNERRGKCKFDIEDHLRLEAARPKPRSQEAVFLQSKTGFL